MAGYNLGQIKKVELRNAWKHEALDFTNWLAEEENLRLLSDEIGIDIKLIQTEATVGRFNVDILAEEETTDNKIIIENQLETTNHDHLGKIITYASGIEAKTIIWVVKDAREEHRQAIDWLNEHTVEDILFFLVKIELWQIGDSPFAPKFELISSPNNWAKTVRQSVSGGGAVTETKTRQMEFWEQFRFYTEERKSLLKIQKPSPQHWLNISVGSRHAHISLTLNSFDEAIRTELYIPANKEVFEFLFQQKDAIESELGMKLEWMELPGKKASRIKAETSGLIDNTAEWEQYFAWLKENAEKFQSVFGKRLKMFKG
jgi:hypothetical protein